MTPLFTREGEAALGEVMRRAPLLAFDFDGTLTPIVVRPDAARLSAAVAARLAALGRRLPVAIISGRSVNDLAGRLGFRPQYLVGNHGAEPEDADGGIGDDAAALAPLRERIAREREQLDAVGVWVEDKGRSIALHYRQSLDRARAQEAIAELLASADDAVKVFGGKLVVNVAPVHAPDKAQALRSILQRAGRDVAVFAGDDLNDEPVFAAAPPTWLTIRVGRAPDSAARFFIDSPAQTAYLLARMLELVR